MREVIFTLDELRIVEVALVTRKSNMAAGDETYEKHAAKNMEVCNSYWVFKLDIFYDYRPLFDKRLNIKFSC